MANLRVPSFILPILLITLSSLSYNANLVGARQLLDTPLPEVPKPKLPELPPLPKVDLPPKPELPELPKSPELPKPELPAFPHLPDLPKPTLPTIPNLPKDFPVIPTHSVTNP
ncbi:hypothetical protein Pint_25273 [Pistacia integerrima]|uniref:Uncharacterized protein n=1 Tax=Pistacia integerrima TaxID=434235 RepID=A0ACC0YC02_9ROSI|nr:hypothetical protein Pint_25273 [Pistacia integerrima]